MRQNYGKLVRDHIPAPIEGGGKRCGVEVMSEEEHRRALKRKLTEDATEVAATPSENIHDLLMELADVQEVLDALLEAHGLEQSTLQAMQSQRREDRGGFTRRLKLLWTE